MRYDRVDRQDPDATGQSLGQFQGGFGCLNGSPKSLHSVLICGSICTRGTDLRALMLGVLLYCTVLYYLGVATSTVIITSVKRLGRSQRKERTET